MLVYKSRKLGLAKNTPFPALADMVRLSNAFTLTKAQLYQIKAVNSNLIKLEWVWIKNHFEIAVEGVGTDRMINNGPGDSYTAEEMLLTR